MFRGTPRGVQIQQDAQRRTPRHWIALDDDLEDWPEAYQRIDALDQRMEERHNAIDKRLRVVEQKAAVAGAISGSAVSIGIALAIEGVKQWLGRGGAGQ